MEWQVGLDRPDEYFEKTDIVLIFVIVTSFEDQQQENSRVVEKSKHHLLSTYLIDFSESQAHSTMLGIAFGNGMLPVSLNLISHVVTTQVCACATHLSI